MMNGSPKKSSLFDLKPILIAALHLPTQPVLQGPLSVNWLEDYVAANLEVFVKGGIQAVKLQDEFITSKRATPEVIALMASIGRFARSNFPELKLGIIIEAHDPVAPLAVANAMNAAFIRLKVFVGAMVKADGLFEGCGAEAIAYRNALGRPDIAILADVHDRTGYPLSNEPIEFAAGWAEYNGADGLILTGHSYKQSLEYLERVRTQGIKLPLILGGGATEDNIREVLQYADGAIVSSSLKKDGAQNDDLIKWDVNKVHRFMDTAVR